MGLINCHQLFGTGKTLSIASSLSLFVHSDGLKGITKMFPLSEDPVEHVRTVQQCTVETLSSGMNQ